MGADRSAELGDTQEGATFCARHPQVETYLTCGRCGTPICPRCLVQTPVGARCRDCANIRRLPTIDVTPAYFARGVAAALVAGAITGGVWATLKANVFFGFFFGILVGLAIGWVVSETVSLATNRKRGLGLQIAAVGGVALAFLVQDMLGGSTPFARAVLRETDLIVLAVGALFAISRLRVG